MFENILKDLSQIIKFDSSQAPAEEGAPFGKGARLTLDYFLGLAASFGFETHDYDGYAGEVIFGEGEEFAILAHLDVVPAGSGWTHAPFGGEIDRANERVWGRGAMDDKGPAIITLYAMKALKDEGFVPRRKIKLIVGCNEENGWGCIDFAVRLLHNAKPLYYKYDHIRKSASYTIHLWKLFSHVCLYYLLMLIYHPAFPEPFETVLWLQSVYGCLPLLFYQHLQNY